jgi:Zn-dependent protease/CBS domain-containing protein
MFSRGGSIQLARILGIRIGVDPSWFLVLFLFIFVLSGSFRKALDSSDTVAYLVAVASALLFFGSLVLHELGHAIAARRQGIETTGIDLWFFGGVAKMSRDSDSPGTEFKIAVAGPLVTLVVIAVCIGVGVAIGGREFWDAAVLDSDAHVGPAFLLLSWLASINALLFVFNLVPAFPLDGGRIARALAWKVTGDRVRATRIAAVLGQGFGYLLMGFGIFVFIRFGSLNGLLWVVLGWFLASAARGAVAQTAFAERLQSVTVADIMDAEPVTVPADLPAAQALDEYFLRYGWDWFPVVEESGRFVGLVRRDRIDEELDAARPHTPVGEVMQADDGDGHVRADAPLEAVLASEALRKAGALMAVDPDGVLRGVVTLEQVRRALAAATSRPVA